jgi:glucose-1-phosphate thymidylyltransferase
MLAGIREILVITTPDDRTGFKRLLGSGSQWGVAFSYEVQPQADGLAQSLTIGAEFIAGGPSALVLGDNLLYGHGLKPILQRVSADTNGATAFAYRLDNPEDYGVVAFREDGKAQSIEEKPKFPQSDWAMVGLYFYDGTAVDRARSLKPSARGELEITDLNNSYLRDGELKVQRLGRGFVWFDAGTHVRLLEASEFIHVIQRRQRQLIASPEEIAWRSGWITADEVAKQAERYRNTNYGSMLAALVSEHSDPFA